MKKLKDIIVDYLDLRPDMEMNNQELIQMQKFIHTVTGYKLEFATLRTVALHHKKTLARKEAKND